MNGAKPRIDNFDKFQIELIPEDGNILDDDWQYECEQLKQQLNDELKEYHVDFKPNKIAETGDEQGYKDVGGMVLFSSLAVFLSESGAIKSVFSGLIDILKPWLQPRRGCKAIIKTPDGHKFELTGLTVEEVLPLMEHFGINLPKIH